MTLSAPHVCFVLAAYGVAALGLGVMIFSSWRTSRKAGRSASAADHD